MSKSKRLALDGMLAAVYFALSWAVIPIGGNLQVRFTSLALVVTALLFGAADACAVAFVGEALYQIVVFGVTVTTPIWLLPPVLHALALGLIAKPLRDKAIPCFTACLCCGALNSVCNTLALWADAKIYGYYSPAVVFGAMPLRLAIGFATATVVSCAAIPTVRALRNRGLLQ